MRLFLTGSSDRVNEFEKKVSGHSVEVHKEAKLPSPDKLSAYDLIVDLNLDEAAERLQTYGKLNKPVIGCAIKRQLADMASGTDMRCSLFGINALPGFIDRPALELSLYREQDRAKLEKICQELGWEYHIVNDRVGMVSPRIVFMIINEAFYTLQEGTATAEDIDESMKLGTNYPHGPFEWCRKTGIKDVYETLEALYQDTHEERYKICPQLKTAYLKRNAPEATLA